MLAMPEQLLEPAKSVIERLGGINAVAAIASKHRTRVYRWMRPVEAGGTGGLIPQREIPRLLAHASANSIPLSADDFLPPSFSAPPMSEASP